MPVSSKTALWTLALLPRYPSAGTPPCSPPPPSLLNALSILSRIRIRDDCVNTIYKHVLLQWYVEKLELDNCWNIKPMLDVSQIATTNEFVIRLRLLNQHLQLLGK